LRRHELGPVPFLLEVRELGEHVLDALDVDASAGVAVPVPGAADCVAPFEHLHLEAGLAQLVQRVQTGEAGADDHDVD
jgi:hypothetical protein